jgi:hypothetical protein
MKSFLIFLFFVKLAHATPEMTFSTRLSSGLSIAGNKCKGNEITQAELNHHLGDYLCTRNEWLISVDYINRCSEVKGWCTEIEMLPITGKLKRYLSIKSDLYTFYNIIPTVPVSPETRWILRRHWVRVSIDGETTVVKKY